MCPTRLYITDFIFSRTIFRHSIIFLTHIKNNNICLFCFRLTAKEKNVKRINHKPIRMEKTVGVTAHHWGKKKVKMCILLPYSSGRTGRKGEGAFWSRKRFTLLMVVWRGVGTDDIEWKCEKYFAMNCTTRVNKLHESNLETSGEVPRKNAKQTYNSCSVKCLREKLHGPVNVIL